MGPKALYDSRCTPRYASSSKQKFEKRHNKILVGFFMSLVQSKNRDRNGDLITNKNEVLMQWEEFFSELLNDNKQNIEEQAPFVFQKQR
uniref:Uncharacterized protein n=1 Tax=Megaselia scalaris TaxID=36166 RepID=T1GWE8_MEGSC